MHAMGKSDTKKSVLGGKYELGRVLGHGAFAKVYLGKNLVDGSWIVMKVVDKEKILSTEGMMEQIKREIAVMKMVKHPNIVNFHEVMASKTKIYFAMEYVKGGELFSKIVKGRLREDEARHYFRQLISAVDFCHSRGVYHRDLKPENLLLDENNNLKVTDFGLSAFRDHIRPDGLLYTMCGTPAYVAPEVLVKRGYDGAKADVWSCGVILYSILAGYWPFRDENSVAMYRKIYKGDFKCPSWFSSNARKLMSLLLDPNPNTRVTTEKLIETHPWFRKPIPSPNPPPPIKSIDQDEQDADAGKPESLNAFHIISLSRGFDLSPLFEQKATAKDELWFLSRESSGDIAAKLEEVAKEVNFTVDKSSEARVKMQGPDRGRKGQLTISAEIFAVAPSFSVVEMRNSGGDTLEYCRFCCDELRPKLKDIICAWHGGETETPPPASSIEDLSSSSSNN